MGKPDIENKFGFVYLISNKKTGKSYIGCKQYWHYKKGKKHKQSNWKVYMGSSKSLTEDIKNLVEKRYYPYNNNTNDDKNKVQVI